MDACGQIVEPAQVILVGIGERRIVGVVHPVVAVVPQDGAAHLKRVRRRQGDGGLGARRTQVAIGQRAESGEFVRRLDGVDLDHASRGVAAEQRALRSAQHFQLLHVEQGEALQIDAFQNHIVQHDRHRLRGGEVEVHIAQAADIEARGVTTVRAFDLQAGHAARQRQDVGAAGRNLLQRLRAQGGDGERHVADVLAAALGRDHDVVDARRFGGGNGLAVRGGLGRNGAGAQQGDAADGGGQKGLAKHEEYSLATGGGRVARRPKASPSPPPEETTPRFLNL